MFLIDRRYLTYFDWLSFGLVLIISSIGLLFIYSATTRPDQIYSIFFKKQLIGIASGIALYITLCIIDHRTIWRTAYFFYYIIIVTLAFTFLKGTLVMGAQRWINLGFMRFQPSELAKILFPAYATYLFFHHKTDKPVSIKDFIPILAMLGISTLLILKQPDLGTALILLFSGTTLLWLMDMPKKFFIYGALIIAMSAPLSWQLLKPYQKKRIAVFLGHGQAHKERYQIEQSTIAIGSGGILGKGFLKGTQNKFLFLPESRTDFIFSVICEEGGLALATVVLLLYLLLFLRLLYITTTIDDKCVRFLALGLIIHLMISAVINICMVIGLLPIVGIPLPLVSYGISNLWISFASLGWFNGIAMRRFYL